MAKLKSAPENIKNRIRREFCPWQYEALTSKATHFGMIGGVALGKTFTGAHFCIYHLVHYPHLTGFIGANTYDQLSQASLRELLYWLEEYEIPFVIDQKPPAEWNAGKRFKNYDNILSVKIGDRVTYAFTRVLMKGDKLRGLEFSWYWIDETRDTPQNTHDIILSRLRESDYVKGLVTSTPAGEDWVWERFVQSTDRGKFDHNSTATEQSVKYGIITEDFYQTLLKTYTKRMADQELFGRHVVVRDGRAYYTGDYENRVQGQGFDWDRPLIVGMDFNFRPAPMVWLIGQVNEDGDKIHWFDEFAESEVSSRQQARKLAAKYGDAFLCIFGDASGHRETTSNNGETDFMQIADELSRAGVNFSIDVDQGNPRVADRVENVCRLLRDADGNIAFTYDHVRCPHLDGDITKVVWKHGKQDASDPKRTHAGDAVGYACWKLFPPSGRQMRIVESIPSQLASMRR